MDCSQRNALLTANCILHVVEAESRPLVVVLGLLAAESGTNAKIAHLLAGNGKKLAPTDWNQTSLHM